MDIDTARKLHSVLADNICDNDKINKTTLELFYQLSNEIKKNK